MMQGHGLAVDRSCVWRWVQDDAPEINRMRQSKPSSEIVVVLMQ